MIRSVSALPGVDLTPFLTKEVSFEITFVDDPILTVSVGNKSVRLLAQNFDILIFTSAQSAEVLHHVSLAEMTIRGPLSASTFLPRCSSQVT